MLRFDQCVRFSYSYSKCFNSSSILREVSTYNARCGFTGTLHQICRNLSTGKKIDAATLNDTDKIKKTSLYEFHVSQGGKMVDFAGYSLPIQYGKQGIAASHKHTR